MVMPTIGGAQLWADRRYRAGWRLQQHALTGHHRLLDPKDRRHVSGEFERALERLSEMRLPPSPPDVVVLLHGLGRTRRSLLTLADALAEDGHHAIRLDYPSTRRTLEEHVAQIVEAIAHLEGAERISFVTHSLGGVLVRGALAHPAWPAALRPQRVVMLAPPNGGAALAEALERSVPTLFGAVMGPAGRQIASNPTFPAPHVPFLVVAGSQGGGGGVNPLLEGDDDGVVRVEETKLEGMTEHLIVESLHTVIMDHAQVREATKRFLAQPW